MRSDGSRLRPQTSSRRLFVHTVCKLWNVDVSDGGSCDFALNAAGSVRKGQQ